MVAERIRRTIVLEKGLHALDWLIFTDIFLPILRVDLIVVLIEARHHYHAESQVTVNRWRIIQEQKKYNREEDARKKDPVLVALEKRHDREFLGQRPMPVQSYSS